MVRQYGAVKCMPAHFFAYNIGQIVCHIPIHEPLGSYFVQVCKHFDLDRDKQNFVYRDKFLTDCNTLLTVGYEGDPIEVIQFR